VENVAGHIKCYISVAWHATIYILPMHAQNLRDQFPVIYDEIFETIIIIIMMTMIIPQCHHMSFSDFMVPPPAMAEL